jgi:putative radical SAM enzyme (TIGR03279 family)
MEVKMPLHIVEVSENSPADKLGIKKGAIIHSINGNHLEDILDYYFHSMDDELTIQFQNIGEEKTSISLNNRTGESLGLTFESEKCKQCINNCIFCFVDQMPEKMRDTLYIKDDDFYFSLTYGNFITLTNLTRHYLDKIIQQQISPLYISIHTTNPALHSKMMRYKREFNIMETIKELSDNDIEMHTQIVLVPDWNDGKELEKSLNDLTSTELNIASIGVVPVGLTKYREKLTPLRTFTKEECQSVIKLTDTYRKKDYDYLYCSDELFIKAEIPIPETEYYNDFEQIENGIGMVRQTWDTYNNNKNQFYKLFKKIDKDICFITGALGEYALKPIVADLQKKTANKYQIKVINNDFFGHSVTVVGLLTWQDVKEHIKPNDKTLYAFSEDFFSFANITLDNASTKDIYDYLKDDYLIIDPHFADYRIINNS